MRQTEAWRLRACTLEAALRLTVARLLVRFVPLRLWRNHLGQRAVSAGTGTAPPTTSPNDGPDQSARARRLAVHVERAARRLPFETKCLPRAIALAGMLRARKISYSLILATRPAAARSSPDSLHAWIEVSKRTVIGELPGRWIVVLDIIG